MAVESGFDEDPSGVEGRSSEAVDDAPRKARLELLSLLFGGALAFFVLHLAFSGIQQRFEEFALGREVKTRYAQVDGVPIHCRDTRDIADCLAGYEARGAGPAVLWLGNSQLHAVNQLKEGQENATPVLFRRLRERGFELLALSQPNANLQEHLVLFTYLLPRIDLRALVLPLVFDDLREIGVRPAIAEAIADPRTADALARHEVGRRILARQGSQGEGDLAALHETVQERSESALSGWLEDHSDMWALRAQARGTLITNLFRLRNTLFGITAQSQRRMIPAPMQMNLEACRAILTEAAEAGAAVIVYVVPLRNDVAIPYVQSEYDAFKRDAEQMAVEHGATFANLESLVPPELWGQKRSTNLDAGEELDFMHFQAGGHLLLAEAVGDLLEPVLSASR